MITQTKAVTIEDLLRLSDEGLHYELVQGELREMAPAKPRHGRYTMNLSTPLDTYVRAHNLGVVFAAETGFVLARNPDTVRAPDVAFVQRERVLAIGDVDEYWPEAPDLVAEVVSPNDSPGEVREKAREWLQAGARLVFIIEPRKRTVTVYRPSADVTTLHEDGMLDGGDVVLGWAMAARDLFV